MSNPELIIANEIAIKRNENIDRTPTQKLFEQNGKGDIYKRCKNIVVNRYKNNTMEYPTQDEIKSFAEAHTFIKEYITNQTTMIKVIPECDIKKYVEQTFDIGSYMLRKADYNNILSSNPTLMKHEALLDSLVLSYPDNKFYEKDNYLGIITVKLPNFSLRTSISSKHSKGFADKIGTVVQDKPTHYTGVGFTANINGIMEFYVSITNKSTDNFNGFPIQAFNVSISVISKINNEEVLIADYSNDTEEGENIYDKFCYPYNQRKKEVAMLISKELGLQDLIDDL